MVRVVTTVLTFLGLLCIGTTDNLYIAVSQTLPSAESQSTPPDSQLELRRLQSEFQKLQSQFSARDEAQIVLERYLQMATAAIGIVMIWVIILQVFTFRANAAAERRSEEEIKRVRDRDIKMERLQDDGIRRAAETLQLINSLLAITERAAAKAAGAQYEFLSKSIETIDAECQRLIVEATKDDERDIIAKQGSIERVKVLTKQIESLDNQITIYNESTPRQLEAEQDDGLPEARKIHSTNRGWKQLALSGSCLFIRGLHHHLDQNFSAAIDDWKASLVADSPTIIKVDSNYWIGYLQNTLGRHPEAKVHLDAALIAAASGSLKHREVELKRLVIETQFFALDLDEVLDNIIDEATAYFETLNPRDVPARSISSFATTIGNISMIRSVRSPSESSRSRYLEESTRWFDKALKAQNRSRWARFGKCQNRLLADGQLNSEEIDDVIDVIGSVKREYDNRIEDRSKALSKVTEYICLLMIGGRPDALSTTASLVSLHAGRVVARTLYSQFRKQNVAKDIFSKEFEDLQRTQNFHETLLKANTKGGFI